MLWRRAQCHSMRIREKRAFFPMLLRKLGYLHPENAPRRQPGRGCKRSARSPRLCGAEVLPRSSAICRSCCAILAQICPACCLRASGRQSAHSGHAAHMRLKASFWALMRSSKPDGLTLRAQRKARYCGKCLGQHRACPWLFRLTGINGKSAALFAVCGIFHAAASLPEGQEARRKARPALLVPSCACSLPTTEDRARAPRGENHSLPAQSDSQGRCVPGASFLSRAVELASPASVFFAPLG